MDSELALSPGRRPELPPIKEPFGCHRRELGAGVVRISLSGELDLASVEELDAILREAARARIVVLDLDALNFIDVSAARVLRMRAARALRTGRRFIAVNAPEHIAKWLTAMGVDRSLKLVSPPEGEWP